MKTSTVIADTSKGKRVFLEATYDVGFMVGMAYHVTYEQDAIVLDLNPAGKRKVVKRGTIDLQGKKVTQWAQGATVANISSNTATGRIIITRG